MLRKLLRDRKVGIVGSRGFKYLGMIEELFLSCLGQGNTIVSGGAKGPDSKAEAHAEHFGIPTIIHKPQWDKFRNSAAFIRNQLIVDDSDVIVSFWDGKSHGTWDTISKALRESKPQVIIIMPKDWTQEGD